MKYLEYDLKQREGDGRWVLWYLIPDTELGTRWIEYGVYDYLVIL